MFELQLDMFQTVGLAAVVFWLGNFLIKKSAFLSKYHIPAPLVGGLVFAILNTILTATGTMNISLDDTLESILMTVFFTTVGFSASIPLIRRGGKLIVLILFVSVVVLTIQNIIGSGIASLFGMDPRLGVGVGSIALMGGPGTAAAFGATMEGPLYGIEGATAVSLAAATFGLVAGSLLGGPTMRKRITQLEQKNQLAMNEVAATKEEAEESMEEEKFETSSGRFVRAGMLLALALGTGVIVSDLLAATGITFPGYMGALLMGAVIRNVVELTGHYHPDKEIITTGEVSLSLFLAMAMMGLELWVLADLAIPIIVILLVQVIFMFLFSYFVLFNILGKNYDAAVQTTGFIGYAMGSTSNAMANMQTITRKYGPSPAAYIAIPIGGTFSDFFNAIIITGFLNFFT
ncbi:sodium/glutamate symporter [Oceanobacillus piezotolerans]|uniref:Sodium/glutamate symporter n=1 Tax=Oceanobacillus piezotolerans TaxID=2448030 RepID=A0A498DD93_9BACI|nr:sodium/glutamate symporter [Oceanobacillus piezotolerans]RLL40579.1 sodium/glutamate symporter [Oceanobacillus piezotolerans]